MPVKILHNQELGENCLLEQHQSNRRPALRYLIGFAHRELGTVFGRGRFVAENFSQFKHSVKASDHQTLQVQFRSNSHFQFC